MRLVPKDFNSIERHVLEGRSCPIVSFMMNIYRLIGFARLPLFLLYFVPCSSASVQSALLIRPFDAIWFDIIPSLDTSTHSFCTNMKSNSLPLRASDTLSRNGCRREDHRMSRLTLLRRPS